MVKERSVYSYIYHIYADIPVADSKCCILRALISASTGADVLEAGLPLPPNGLLLNGPADLKEA